MYLNLILNYSILPAYFYFIVASFLASFLLFKQPGTGFYLKLFCPFLGVSVLVESYAIYLRNHGYTNVLLYSFFTATEFVFYLYFLSCIIKNFKIRLLIRYILVFNAVIALINTLFIQKNGFNTISYSFSCLLVVSFCIYYFLELFRYPKFVKLSHEPTFWICSALLFYYCCSFPLYGLLTLLSAIPQSLIANVIMLMNVVNVLLYTLYIVAFVCRLKIGKRASASLNS